MPEKVGLVVAGAAGRMGTRVLALAQADPRFRIAGRLLKDTPKSERDHFVRAADVAVDFSIPAASMGLARACAAGRKPLVIGTTGFTSSQRAELSRLARKTPIFLAANFSRGVALLLELSRRAAETLSAYDAAVFEVHHRAKRDAPSGTALELARAVSQARREKSLPIASLRVGSVVGEHTLTLAGPFERLELTHRAQSRDVFAQGALDAAAWIAGRNAGLYGMADLLGGP